MNGLKPIGAIRASTALTLCCAMLLLGAAAGYGLRGAERVQIQTPAEQQAAQPQATPVRIAAEGGPAGTPDSAAQVAQMGEATLSPTAKVLWRCHMACGHTVEREDAQPAIGKTKAELEAAYGPGSVESFSPEGAVISQAFDYFCPEHYVLKLENGALTVRKTNEELQEETLLALDVALPADAAAECAQGLPFDSLEDINVYLEGLEG